MVINTNISAQTSARLLSESSNLLSKSLARLSSGSKIVSPEDDAGGLAVSMRFDAQINRLGAVSNNVANAVSFSQTQDGFLKNIAKILDRLSELSVQAQDTLKSPSDRALYNQEFTTLAAYFHDLAMKDFNGVSLFNGVPLNVTVDSDANTFAMNVPDLWSATYTNTMALTIDTIPNAANALTTIRNAITQLASDRARVGANITRLTMTSSELGILTDNLTAANSRIKDVDVAAESTQFAKYNILVQAGTAMLAQANAAPQTALRLLQ